MADKDIERTDPLIARVRDTLSPMPRVDASDVARMLVSVHSRRRTMRERVLERIWFMRIPSVSTLGVASVAVLALTVGFMSRDALDRETAPAVASAGESLATSATLQIDSAARALPVAATALDELEVPVQFVLNVPNATTVALVGDFNGWDATAAGLERVPGQSLWTATVNLKPGRHVYAFVVDGSKWIRDPRAAEAVDEDFGRPQSVIVVQAPWTGAR